MRCTCISNIPENFTNLESMNSKVLRQIMCLPNGLRKEIRLLAKQYELLEFYKEPDDIYETNIGEKRIIRNQPYILKYRHFEGSIEFEWKIEPERLYIK